MAVNPPQLVNVTCPACQTRYTAPVQNVIDVGRESRLKTMLLQGRVNVGVCPSCGTAGMLSIPMAYHDPEKELLFCLVPQELGMAQDNRQRVIGELSSDEVAHVVGKKPGTVRMAQARALERLKQLLGKASDAA